MRVKSPLLNDTLFDKNLGVYAQRDGFTAIKGQIKKLGSLVDGLAAIRDNRDPFKTQAQIEVDYKKSFEKAQASAQDSMQRTINTIVKLQDEARQRMFNRTKLNLQSPHAQEIRQVLRAFGDSEQGEKKRSEFLNKAIQSGKADIINAVISTPAELSFLTDRKSNEIFDMYIDKHAPEYREEMKAIDKAEEMLKLAYDSFEASSTEMRDPNLEVESETAKQKADVAEQALNSALSE